MRIGKTTLSPVAFYSEPLWAFLISYRVFLVTWRVIELSLIAFRFLIIRAPFLIVWTRLPIVRNISIPHLVKLQRIMEPRREKRIGIAGGRSGTKALDQYESLEMMAAGLGDLGSSVKPRSWFQDIVGVTLRGLITELGSVFIKLAQIMSMRPEIPPFLREELALIQDRLPALPRKEVKTILERELKRPVNDVFEWVADQPIAAASLASVYHAKLKTGEEVALKIQRPFLQGIVALDTIIILKLIVGLANLLLPQLRKTDITIFTLSFQTAIKREINFELEGHIQETCREYILNDPVYSRYMKIAQVYFDYTTTKLLTMEFVKGYVRWDDLLSLSPDEIWELVTMRIPGYPEDEPAHFLYLASRFPISLAWQTGIFHGDMHLANVMALRPENLGDNWRIFLCDFGMYESLPVGSEQLEALVEILEGIFWGDADLLVDAVQHTHVMTGARLTDVDWEPLQAAMRDFQRTWWEPSSDELGTRLRTRRAHEEGGWTKHFLSQLTAMVGLGVVLPYWAWLAIKSYVYEEEMGMAFFGSSYDWAGSICDPLAVLFEKEAVLRVFDQTNVFQIDDSINYLKHSLPRGKDYEKVINGLCPILNADKARYSWAKPPAP
ncbi:MAG: AarF/UbiB family protein [Chloroflexota bacterium]|nr:AarF/UbiB family protein [Chloroflexota bacterium]